MRLASEFMAHDGWVETVAFGEDGTLFSGGWDRLAKRWNPVDGSLVNAYAGHDKTVDAVVVSPDGRLLLTASVDGTARVWDVDGVEPLHVLSGHRQTVAALAITPDGKTAVTGSYDRTIRLWDLSHGAELGVLKCHAKNVVSLAVSPDGRTLASGGIGDDVRIWNLATQALLSTFVAHERAVGGLQYLPNGHSLVSTGADAFLRVWDTADFSKTSEVLLGAGGTHTLAVSPDGRFAAVACDRAVKLVDLGRGTLRETLPIPVKGVYGVAYSRDGRLLAAASADKMVRVWETGDVT